MNAIGACGLALYNFGQTVSIPFFTDSWRPDSWLVRILENWQLGLHTLCLLDIKVKEQSEENLARCVASSDENGADERTGGGRSSNRLATCRYRLPSLSFYHYSKTTRQASCSPITSWPSRPRGSAHQIRRSSPARSRNCQRSTSNASVDRCTAL